jgi:hypothetical protein
MSLDTIPLYAKLNHIWTVFDNSRKTMNDHKKFVKDWGNTIIAFARHKNMFITQLVKNIRSNIPKTWNQYIISYNKVYKP